MARAQHAIGLARAVGVRGDERRDAVAGAKKGLQALLGYGLSEAQEAPPAPGAQQPHDRACPHSKVLEMDLAGLAPWAVLIAALFFFLWLDLHFFARGREPSFKEAAWWSVGWLVLGLLAALAVWAYEGSEDAVLYTTVYLIERSLSLDNLFVFLLLFAYFGVPYERRPRLLFWGIVAALALRGAFIIGGTALIEQFHVVIYILGVGAARARLPDLPRCRTTTWIPDKNLMVRLVRRFYPVTGEFREGHWFVKEKGQRYVTPLFLTLVAIVFADIAFAIDSIPAAFAITTDPLLIWMGNVFALLGLRALFVLVESLIARFRYLDETIAVVLGLVGVKLLIEDIVKIGPRAEPRHDRRGVRDRDRALVARRQPRPGCRGEARGADGAHEGDARGRRSRRPARRSRRALGRAGAPSAARAPPGARPTGRPPRPSTPRRRTSARAWGGRAPRGPRAGCPRGRRRPAGPAASAPPGG